MASKKKRLNIMQELRIKAPEVANDLALYKEGKHIERKVEDAKRKLKELSEILEKQDRQLEELNKERAELEQLIAAAKIEAQQAEERAKAQPEN